MRRLNQSVVEWILGAALVTLAIGLAVSCGSDRPLDSTEGTVFTVRVGQDSSRPGQTFKVLIKDPSSAAEAESLIGQGNKRIIVGPVRRGDGGVNAPWAWHLDPDSISFADQTIELCDGTPDYVNRNLDSWIDSVGNYCPWSTEIVGKD